MAFCSGILKIHCDQLITKTIAVLSRVRVKWLVSSIVCALIPIIVRAESSLFMQQSSTPTSISAHVNFMIVIPKVLYLRVESVSSAPIGERASRSAAALVSNIRNVALRVTTNGEFAGSNVLIAAPVGRVIRQQAKWTQTYANSVVAPTEMYGGQDQSSNRVLYTATAP